MENIDEPLFTGLCWVFADLLKLTDSAWLPTESQRGNMQDMAGTNMFPVEHGLQTFFRSFKLELPFFLFSDNYKRTFIDCWLLEK